MKNIGMREMMKKTTAVLCCAALAFGVAFAPAGVLESHAAAPATIKIPSASGIVTYGNDKVKVDASNLSQGYVMIKYTGTNQKVKIQISKTGSETYTYNVTNRGNYETFPLSAGSGAYTVKVFENTSGTKYSQAWSGSVTAQFESDYLPFLYPNQYVNFSASSATVSKGAELCAGKTKAIDKVTAVYTYVVTNFTYDKQKAASVQSGYLPNVDTILSAKKGICFDYAAVMASMLRSQGVPTKLVVGYAGQAYHAWLNVYSAEEGWINKAIYFDGKTWKLMDPTFASSGKQSDSIMKYIGDGSHYTTKFVY